jgi:hypothetical protein
VGWGEKKDRKKAGKREINEERKNGRRGGGRKEAEH